MSYQNLDNEEILRLAISAIDQDNHVEAISLLKGLLERDSNHVFANYLLAAEHAQIGMVDRAEAGFSRTVALAPDFNIARFQLGQIHLVKGDNSAAKLVLEPLTRSADQNQELSHYAKGLVALTEDNVEMAVSELQAGLAYQHEIPALAADMRRIVSNLAGSQPHGADMGATILAPHSPQNIYMFGYKSDN
ncbi:MAG TPA: hypothetical protein VN247_07895 [Arenimonas sp.]|nr:hypothetical protein [Arenimonas sp.]